MIKKRDFGIPSVIGVSYDDNPSAPKSSEVKQALLVEQKTLNTNNHPGWYRARNADIGGFFRLDGSMITHRPSEIVHVGTGYHSQLHYHGRFVAVSGYAGISNPGSANPDVWGADAYARMKPTKPDFAALNFAIEGREIPEMIKKRFTRNLRGISSFWLAVQFGWKPLLKDCRELVLLQQKAQHRLKQLIRDNGKPVRRRITLRDVTSNELQSDSATASCLAPSRTTGHYVGTPRRREIAATRHRTWASARFRYWLPPGPRDIVWQRKMMAVIFGFKPSPAAVYNAMPWTWLADWFTNAGEVIENLDAGVANRLAADYYYVMESIERTLTTFSSGKFRDWDTGQIVEVTASREQSVFSKARAHGDPFGFNTKEENLSGMQLSILGALGMSRLR